MWFSQVVYGSFEEGYNILNGERCGCFGFDPLGEFVNGNGNMRQAACRGWKLPTT
jgi:hypothetical protein